MNDFDIYFNFVKEIETKEENKSKYKIIDVFTHFLLSKYSNESNYLLENMIEHNLVEPKIGITNNKTYFVHHMSGGEIC